MPAHGAQAAIWHEHQASTVIAAGNPRTARPRPSLCALLHRALGVGDALAEPEHLLVRSRAGVATHGRRRQSRPGAGVHGVQALGPRVLARRRDERSAAATACATAPTTSICVEGAPGPVRASSETEARRASAGIAQFLQDPEDGEARGHSRRCDVKAINQKSCATGWLRPSP